MRVVVVGAGIAGLATAVGLGRAGVDVVVVEQGAQLRAHGSGLSLFGNGLRALEVLGLSICGPDIPSPDIPSSDVPGPGAQATTAAATPGRMHRSGLRRPDGGWLSDLGHAAVAELRVIDRAELHRVLAAAVPAGAIRTDCRVIDLVDSSVVLDGDTVLDADVIVGADGLRSRVRGGGAFDDPGLRYAGYGAWRAITSVPVPIETSGETIGRGRRFGIAPLADGRVYWFACESAPPGEPAGGLDEVRRRFGGWHAPIAALLDATDPASVSYESIEELARPLGSFVAGRAVLVGDAAHAMTPNLGQGANQALEDATVLAHLIGGARTLGVESALSRYDALRRRRTQRIARQARLLGSMMQMRHPVSATLRDLAIGLVPPRMVSAQSRRLQRWSPPADTGW